MIAIIKKHWRLLLLGITIFFRTIYLNTSLVMKNLPTGDYINSLSSPNNDYVLNAYRYSGGATVAWSLRVEVVDNKSGKIKNIYWKYKESDSQMYWIDENTVLINEVRLNIHKILTMIKFI